MPNHFQLSPADNFPCFQRILTFLANCGWDSYGLKFSWFDRMRRLFYPFTHRYNRYNGGWFEADDEAILREKEQASIDANIFVGNVLADATYSLELDHGYYRIRYSAVTTERQQLIHDLLAEKGITQYELTSEVSEGNMLPPYQNFSTIENCSGTVVTPTAVYGFWLGWANGRHTLGEERGFWHEYTLEHIRPHGKFPGFEREVEEARRRLYLRRCVETSEVNGRSEIWELREEDANQSI
jgi:hypothetical protein